MRFTLARTFIANLPPHRPRRGRNHFFSKGARALQGGKKFAFPPCRKLGPAGILPIVLSDTPQGAVAPAPPTRSHPASASASEVTPSLLSAIPGESPAVVTLGRMRRRLPPFVSPFEESSHEPAVCLH